MQHTDDSNPLSRVIQYTKELADLTKRELHKLSSNPDYFSYAEKLMDSFLNICSGHLCHYSTIIDNDGNAHCVQDMLVELREQLEDYFTSLTGREYTSQFSRNLRNRIASN